MIEHHADDQHERLRPPPGERFAGDSHVFDLGAALRDLRAEAPATQRGHRQVTILKHMAVTQVLFSFESGSEPEGPRRAWTRDDLRVGRTADRTSRWT